MKAPPLGNTVGVVIINGCKKCMNTCAFCLGEQRVPSEWLSLIQSAEAFFDAGLTNIEISGADPGEYPRLVDFVKYLRAIGGIDRDRPYHGIYLATHGRNLKDEKLVRDLKDAGVSLVKISLYGSTPEMHNKFTQIRDSSGDAFSDTIQGLKNCAEYDIPVLGNIIPTQYNKEHLNDTIQVFLAATNRKIKSIHIRTPFLVMTDYRFTDKWYLPVKDMKPYLKEVYLHHPPLPEGMLFVMNEIPYCVLGENTPLIDNASYAFGANETTSKGKPTIGILQKHTDAKVSEDMPDYRRKHHFEECDHCILKSKCVGISYNEFQMFGAYGLKAIKG